MDIEIAGIHLVTLENSKAVLRVYHSSNRNRVSFAENFTQ